MTTRRLGVAVAVLGGYLYAIGGSDGQSPLNTVERYDPRHNKWSLVSPMSTRRKHLGCAVFNNLIYAVGGRDDCMELSSAERYNPHTNTWSPIVAMTSRRSGVSQKLKVQKLNVIFTITSGWFGGGQRTAVRCWWFRWDCVFEDDRGVRYGAEPVEVVRCYELQKVGWRCRCDAGTANGEPDVVKEAPEEAVRSAVVGGRKCEEFIR